MRPEAPFWKPNGSRNGAKTEAKTDEGNDRNFLTKNAPKRPQKGAPKWPRRHPKREQKPTPKRERKNTLKNKPVLANEREARKKRKSYNRKCEHARNVVDLMKHGSHYLEAETTDQDFQGRVT